MIYKDHRRGRKAKVNYTFLLGRSAALFLLLALPVFGQQPNLDQTPGGSEEIPSQQSPTEALTFSEAERDRARGAAENAHRESVSADRELATALEAVNQATRAHLDVLLKDVLGKSTDQAKPPLQQAQQLSKTGGEVGLGRLRALHDRRAKEEARGKMKKGGPPATKGPSP